MGRTSFIAKLKHIRSVSVLESNHEMPCVAGCRNIARLIFRSKSGDFNRRDEGVAGPPVLHQTMRQGDEVLAELQLEQVNGSTSGDGREGLQRQHAQRPSWRLREPFEREVRY